MMWSVAAIGKHPDLRRKEMPVLARLDLFNRAVLVFVSLKQKNWASDGIQIRLDVPRTKTRVKPDIVPTPECCVHVPVMLIWKIRRHNQDFC